MTCAKRYNDTADYYLLHWRDKLREYRHHPLPLDRSFRSLMASTKPRISDLRAGVRSDVDGIKACVRCLDVWAMLITQGKAMGKSATRCNPRKGVSPMSRALLNDYHAAIDEHEINQATAHNV